MKDKMREILEEKTACDYDKIAFNFSSTRQIIWKDISLLEKYVNQGDTVLDYGCGNGRLVQILKDKEVRYIGVDSCQAFIDIATQQYGSSNTSFYHTSQEKEKEYSYDVIFSIAVLHHIPSHKKRFELVCELHSLLNPQGKLIITSWNLWQKRYRHLVFEYMRKKIFCQSLEKEIDKEAKACDLDFKDTFVPFQDSGVYRYVHAFTKKELVQLVKSAGFTILDAYYSDEEKKTSIGKGKNIIIISQK